MKIYFVSITYDQTRPRGRWSITGRTGGSGDAQNSGKISIMARGGISRTMMKSRPTGSNNKRVRRRTNMEIIAKILESANGQILPSKLILKANLNTRRMQIYSDMLLEMGLLVKKTVTLGGGDKRIVFMTSEKGLQFLSVLKGIKEIDREIGAAVKESKEREASRPSKGKA
jgi:predicted transcriptional regulator